MITRTAKLATAGLALGTALSLVAMTGTAHARTATIQAHSNLRAGATTDSRLVGTTQSESETEVRCFTYGEYVKIGRYGTNVWYHINVFQNDPAHGWIGVYAWGGNVNVGQDPASGVPHC